MARRMLYVRAASRFKPSESSIPAPERVAQMLPQRRQWAEEVGLDGDLFKVYLARLSIGTSPSRLAIGGNSEALHK